MFCVVYIHSTEKSIKSGTNNTNIFRLCYILWWNIRSTYMWKKKFFFQFPIHISTAYLNLPTPTHFLCKTHSIILSPKLIGKIVFNKKNILFHSMVYTKYIFQPSKSTIQLQTEYQKKEEKIWKKNLLSE